MNIEQHEEQIIEQVHTAEKAIAAALEIIERGNAFPGQRFSISKRLGKSSLLLEGLTQRLRALATQRATPRPPAPKPAPKKYNNEPIIWTPDLERLLGTKSDASLARDLDNRRPSVIRKRRLELKIASFGEGLDNARREKELAKYAAIEWPPELLAKIGTRMDGYLSKTYGIPAWAIAKKRDDMGIKLTPFSHLETDAI